MSQRRVSLIVLIVLTGVMFACTGSQAPLTEPDVSDLQSIAAAAKGGKPGGGGGDPAPTATYGIAVWINGVLVGSDATVDEVKGASLNTMMDLDFSGMTIPDGCEQFAGQHTDGLVYATVRTNRDGDITYVATELYGLGRIGGILLGNGALDGDWLPASSATTMSGSGVTFDGSRKSGCADSSPDAWSVIVTRTN